MGRARGRSITQHLRATIKAKADGRILELLNMARDDAQETYDNLQHEETYDGPINIVVSVRETKDGFSLTAKGQGVRAIEYGADGSEGTQVLTSADGVNYWFFQPANDEYIRTPEAGNKVRFKEWGVEDEEGNLVTDSEYLAEVMDDWQKTYGKTQKSRMSTVAYLRAFGDVQAPYEYTDYNWIYTEGNEEHKILEDAMEMVKKELRR